MHLKQFGWAAGLTLLASSVQAASQPEIQELFKASRTPGDRVGAYPQGTPEMRVVTSACRLEQRFRSTPIHHPWSLW